MNNTPHFKKLLAGQSIAYIAINVFPSVMALLTSPFYTRVLTTAEYGIAGVYLAIVTAVLSCLECSILTRRAYVRYGKTAQLSEEVSGSIVIYAIGTLVILALTFLSWGVLADIVPISPLWLFIAIMSGFLQACMTIGFALMQIAQSIRMYCTVKVLFTLFNVGVAVAGLFYFSAGWIALAWASALPSVAALAVAAVYCVRHFRLRWLMNIDVLTRIGRSIISLIPHRVSIAIFTYAGPLVVVYYSDLTQSGLYTFAFQICILISLVYESLLYAIIPHVVNPDSQALTGKGQLQQTLVILYVATICFISVALALVAPPVIRLIFPAAYAQAVPYIYWIALARCFHGIHRLIQELLFFHVPGFRKLSWYSLVSACLYLVLTVTLLQKYGGIGAGIGLALGHGVWLLAMLFCGMQWLKHKPTAQ